MSLFDKLFGTREARAVKRISKDLEATYGPVSKLSSAIVGAAYGAQQSLADVFGFQINGEAGPPQSFMFCEFLYFFAHVTTRAAVANGFTEPQIEKLHGYLAPALASTAVDYICAHWAEDVKKKLANCFCEDLSNAGVEYSECTDLVLSDDPLSGNTLIAKVATKAADVWERSSDKSAKMAVANVIGQVFMTMELDGLIANVKPVIDSVDSEFIREYWRAGWH